MPSDRLTPAQLRDLAEIFDSAVPGVTGHAYGALSTMRAICNSEAARREAEAKPQNGRGHIPLITCPGSTKSCMGYDCLDKGCLDGEPMASGGVSVPELRNSNISLGGCEVCTTPTACKQEKHCDHFDCEWTRAVPDDELGRASGETGPSPSPVTTGLPPQGEREGPGSAATPVRGTAAPDLVAHAAESNAPLWIAPNGTGFVHVGFTLADVRRLARCLSELMEVVGSEANARKSISGDLAARLYDCSRAGSPFLPLLKEPRDGE